MTHNNSNKQRKNEKEGEREKNHRMDLNKMRSSHM